MRGRVRVIRTRSLESSNCVRRRWTGTVASEGSADNLPTPQELVKEGWLFFDSVFPIRFGTWDLRHYIGVFRKETLLTRLDDLLRSVKTHGFEPLSLEPHQKDGGVFVKFKYTSQNEEQAVQEIVYALREASGRRGGIPSWISSRYLKGNVWVVRGKPWIEDMNRFASPMLKVEFEGPDVREEGLYEILRPFGRVLDLTSPSPVPAGTLRSSIVTFRHVRSAATAHNCIHGLAVPVSKDVLTKLHTIYEKPIKGHAVRDWITSHPRIVLPVVVFLFGTLTYTIFDPIRAFAVEGKLLDSFDYRKSRWFQWIQQNAVDRLSFALASHHEASTGEASLWKEREEAEADIRRYVSDLPNTVAFVHGPQGSGKTRMLNELTKNDKRPVLWIDCAELYKASSDSAVLLSLARQTGYWPIFPFVNSLNNLIDVASVGLIGQKAGLSASLDAQVKQILEVVGAALKSATQHERTRAQRAASSTASAAQHSADEQERRARMMRGTWHDPRLDCVAGNGVMSELGVGDELMRPEDYESLGVDIPVEGVLSSQDAPEWEKLRAPREAEEKLTKEPASPKDTEMLETLPIVIIKNYATKRGKDDVLTVLAQWTATLVENNIAHVIVASDNRENAKHLAQALPSKPLHFVALSDADASSSLAFVTHRLQESGIGVNLSSEQTASISRLGGRASDLESLIHKVRSGQRIEDAVEDIIGRSVSELRKNAFGDDTDDAKNLAWKREQAWAVMKQLAKADELAYHQVLLDFPFKGDETALRNMEHAELITIGTLNGRPSVIKPGRPVYKYVFERLVADSIFRATQEIASNTLRISSAEASIRECEEELIKLRTVGLAPAHWWSRRPTTAVRAAYLLKKMQEAEAAAEMLEAVNASLKKTLVKVQ